MATKSTISRPCYLVAQHVHLVYCIVLREVCSPSAWLRGGTRALSHHLPESALHHLGQLGLPRHLVLRGIGLSNLLRSCESAFASSLRVVGHPHQLAQANIRLVNDAILHTGRRQHLSRADKCSNRTRYDSRAIACEDVND